MTSKQTPQQGKNSEKNLEFWNFTEEGIVLEDKSAFKSTYPDGKVASHEEMNKINETLKRRLQFFKNSSCYNYLDCYYDYYLKTLNSKNEETMDKNCDYSLQCLKLFTFCWEIEQEEKGEDKSSGDNNLL